MSNQLWDCPNWCGEIVEQNKEHKCSLAPDRVQPSPEPVAPSEPMRKHTMWCLNEIATKYQEQAATSVVVLPFEARIILAALASHAPASAPSEERAELERIVRNAVEAGVNADSTLDEDAAVRYAVEKIAALRGASPRPSEEWREAVAEVGIAGIYADFESAADTIRQMGHYIKEAEAALPIKHHGWPLSEEIAALVREPESDLKAGSKTGHAGASPVREERERALEEAAVVAESFTYEMTPGPAPRTYGFGVDFARRNIATQIRALIGRAPESAPPREHLHRPYPADAKPITDEMKAQIREAYAPAPEGYAERIAPVSVRSTERELTDDDDVR